MLGLSWAYRYTLGAAMIGMARAIGSIRVPSFLGGFRLLGFAADALSAIDNTIRHALGVGVDAMQAAWNDALSYTAYAIKKVGEEIASLAHDTAQAVERTAVTQVTNVYRRVNPALARRVGVLAAAVAALERRLVHVATREAHTAKAKAQAVEHAISIPDIGAVPRAIPRVGELEREIGAVGRRVGDFARRLAPAALVGIGVYALAKAGLTWLRCGRVNRVGKQICGMNDGMLDSLLAGTVLIVGTVSLVEFARGMQGVMDEIDQPVREFWRATG